MADRNWIGLDTPGDWSVAANWAEAAVPIDGDDVYLTNTSQSVTTGFAQGAIALNSLNISQSFTGDIGDASNYLNIGAATVRIGYFHGPGNAPNGSGLIKLDLDDDDDTAATVIIENSGTPTDQDLPAIRLLTIGATTVEVNKGSVGIACEPGETSTLATVTIGYVGNKAADAEVLIGAGVTLTTLSKTGGRGVLGCAATTLTNDGGTVLTTGSGAITTVNVGGGTGECNSTGTITNLNVDDAGHADFSKSSQPRTVTNPKVDPNGKITYDPSIVTMTNKIQPISSSGAVSVAVTAA